MRGLVTLDVQGNMHDGSHVTVDDETVLLVRCSRMGSRVPSERLADTLGAQRWRLVEDSIQRHPTCLTFEVERLPMREWESYRTVDVVLVEDEQPPRIAIMIRLKPMGLAVGEVDDLGEMLEEMIHKLGPLVPPGVSSRDAWMVTSASRITWAEDEC